MSDDSITCTDGSVEFPVRVALPARADGVRRDMQGRRVVWRNSNGWWVDGGDGLSCLVGRGEEGVSDALERLDIIDITERGEAWVWGRRNPISKKITRRLVGFGATHYGCWVDSESGEWSLYCGIHTVVARGTAPTPDEAKAQADHYAAMLYDLDGGAFAVQQAPPAATPEPPPTGSGPVVLDRVVRDLQARAAVGREKYGTLLRADNGRDAMLDAYQEVLDLAMYICQHRMEQARRDSELEDWRSWASQWHHGTDSPSDDELRDLVTAEIAKGSRPETSAKPLAGVVFDGVWRSTFASEMVRSEGEWRSTFASEVMRSEGEWAEDERPRLRVHYDFSIGLFRWAIETPSDTIASGHASPCKAAREAAEAKARDLGAIVRGGE